MKLSLGGNEFDKVEITVHGYEREPVGEYYDDNWLRCAVDLRAGGFSGHYSAAFMTDDFSRFLSGLNSLYDTLSGKAEFNTIEEQLMIIAEGDGKGHIEVRGEALDAAGHGNRLAFSLGIDQTQLATVIKELKEITAKYPVRGE